jgi:DNA-binding HxlR family transcriptional regulator
VRAQLVPEGAEAPGVRPYRADVKILVPVRVGRGVLGKRWTAIILGHLSHGPAGFRDLSRGTGGISDSVLSERLGDLAAGGLITRTVRDGPPVTVTYELTERGRALMPALDQIAEWARDNLPPDNC